MSRLVFETSCQVQLGKLEKNWSYRGSAIGCFICPHVPCFRKLLLASVLPGDSIVGGVFVGGFLNFFSLYSNLLIVRVLLSWFPAAQNQPILRPLFTLCDPYLNLFRSVVPPVFGIDFSPILAFTALQFFSTATIALGAEDRVKSTCKSKSTKKGRFL
ncbi:YlmG homolog protein 2, chloroplastic [Galdieria sulphuraria]|uniref:YggT family protein n=1 Tax=Galdieria sulphuraria TaxID=130081 RepID=M2WX31_GALSU|nr:YggT family protein [Galdieria sulphuraria]EME28575.1 YggT family protein [Galdieria sulphuraria]GJD08533.1 YlmG homolog protein 2, chloroplastic [Galdieria sulphuraria]|eukprot:XP_005705095.1 YggT family protein [Galdieria sulphuraria]